MSDSTPLITTDATTVPFFKKRPVKSGLRKRLASLPPAPSLDESESDSDSPETTTNRKLKKRRKNTSIVTSETSKPGTVPLDEAATKYIASSRDIVSTAAGEATKKVNWYDDDGSLSTKKLLGKRTERVDDHTPKIGGMYKGASSYGSFIQKSEHAAQRTFGPVKQSTNVRTITVTDYAPDVCKDYKLTGFCGFGDTCKFLHAREDYAQGWKIDREWEKVASGQKIDQQIAEEDDEMKELKNIPFKCVICTGDYKSPIVTKCGHYFCEECAIKRYKRNPSCKICGKGTEGVFNGAKRLREKLERKREREDEVAKTEQIES